MAALIVFSRDDLVISSLLGVLDRTLRGTTDSEAQAFLTLSAMMRTPRPLTFPSIG